MKDITLTKEGGNYYRAIAVHWLLSAPAIMLFLVLVILAIINPLWFRDSFIQWVEHAANRFARWRDNLKYRIYLGTDPEMWHALKD